MSLCLTMSAGGVPAGSYVGELIAVEPWNENVEKYGPGIVFRWRVIGGPHDGQEASRICGAKLTPKAGLAKILAGLKGGKIEQGETIDPAAFIGQRFLLIVEETESGSTRVATVLKQA